MMTELLFFVEYPFQIKCFRLLICGTPSVYNSESFKPVPQFVGGKNAVTYS